MIQPSGHLSCVKTAGASLTWTMCRLNWQHVGAAAPHLNLPGFTISAHAVMMWGEGRGVQPQYDNR